MRCRHLFAPTLRQISGEVEMASHRLLLRAGFVRQLVAGVYSLLPLGLRVMQKIDRMVREEMNAAGAQEVFLPALHPLELWEKSGRAESWGPELMRLEDRNGRPFCLGGTHEEVITTLVGASVRSYRELPFTLYQIQTKFRDDPRPRGGLVRLREFSMKDAYSFDLDRAGLDRSYELMLQAYHRIFRRIGLPYHVVEASGGTIGGWDTVEFELPAEAGESHYLQCSSCGYSATPEVARLSSPARPESAAGPLLAPSEAEGPAQRVDTPDQRTIEAVTAFLGLPASRLVKTLIYRAGDGIVAALVRGDRELSEDKLRAVVGRRLQMADAPTVERVSGAPVGYAGPIGLKEAEIIADEELRGERNFVTGGNAADTHVLNVNWGRDFQVSRWADLRKAEPGDLCANCGQPLQELRGIEMGHIFKLGTIYSEPLGAHYLDEQGQRKPIMMGCYGLGNTRMLAAIAEHFHDDAGLLWPVALAPFEVIVVPVNHDDQVQRVLAEDLYGQLGRAGLEALLEDRAERPGVKFKDADLIGIPGQVVVGRLAGEGKVEVRRRGGETRTVEAGQAVAVVKELLMRG
jgi:prolyl-tRNA synthetase